jgi:hypothetical protein
MRSRRAPWSAAIATAAAPRIAISFMPYAYAAMAAIPTSATLTDLTAERPSRQVA